MAYGPGITGTNMVPVSNRRNRVGNSSPAIKQEHIKQEPEYSTDPRRLKGGYGDTASRLSINQQDGSPPRSYPQDDFPRRAYPPDRQIGRSLAPTDIKNEPGEPLKVPRKRKNASRWGEEAESNKVAGLIGLPTAIMSHMSAEQLDAYTIHLRIQEISSKLKIEDFAPPQRSR